MDNLDYRIFWKLALGSCWMVNVLNILTHNKILPLVSDLQCSLDLPVDEDEWDAMDPSSCSLKRH